MNSVTGEWTEIKITDMVKYLLCSNTIDERDLIFGSDLRPQTDVMWTIMLGRSVLPEQVGSRHVDDL